MLVPLAISLAMPAVAQDRVERNGAGGRYALLIGHNDGGDGRAILRYAHDDYRTSCHPFT